MNSACGARACLRKPSPTGTVCLFFPGYDTLSAVLYVIGSLGFLAVDVQVPVGGGSA